MAVWSKQLLLQYPDNNYCKDLNQIDGQPMEFEWKIFPGFTAVGLLNADDGTITE